jgi:hypothetical protein
MDDVMERRRRTLTDEDIAAISAALRNDHCACSFTDEEVQAIRGMVELMKETRSYVLKGVVSVFVIGIFTILALGFKQWAK